MTRFSLLLALALVLGACDAAAPSSTTDATSVPAPMASASAFNGVHHLTETLSITTEGDRVLLTIDGYTVDFGAGEAYLVGQTLASVGFETLDPELAGRFPRPGGDKCYPTDPGGAVLAVGGELFDKCPPPPPPPLLQDVDFLSLFLDGAPVEVVEAPEGLEWTRIPGGYTAPY